jgi:hypothetical protein
MEQYKNWETNNEIDALRQEMKTLSDNIRFEMDNLKREFGSALSEMAQLEGHIHGIMAQTHQATDSKS